MDRFENDTLIYIIPCWGRISQLLSLERKEVYRLWFCFACPLLSFPLVKMFSFLCPVLLFSHKPSFNLWDHLLCTGSYPLVFAFWGKGGGRRKREKGGGREGEREGEGGTEREREGGRERDRQAEREVRRDWICLSCYKGSHNPFSGMVDNWTMSKKSWRCDLVSLLKLCISVSTVLTLFLATCSQRGFPLVLGLFLRHFKKLSLHALTFNFSCLSQCNVLGFSGHVMFWW